MIPPTTTPSEEVERTELIERLAMLCLGHLKLDISNQWLPIFADWIIKDRQAQKEALIAKVLAEVIGEDEPLPNMLGFMSDTSDMVENQEAKARNNLRAEQRKALAEAVKGGQDNAA